MASQDGPPRHDVWLWRGDDDPPLRWEFGTSADPDNLLAGSTFVLAIEWPGGELTRSTETGELVIEGRCVVWPYSAADTLAVPHGADARYELRRSISGRGRTWVWGAFKTRTGIGK